jgi:hypothetical protein
MASVAGVLLVLAQPSVHGRGDLKSRRVDARALDAAVAGKVAQHRDQKRNVPPPLLVHLGMLTVLEPVCVHEAHRQVLGILVSQIHLASESHEMLPDRAVAPQRSSAVAKLLQLAQCVCNQPIQRQIGYGSMLG